MVSYSATPSSKRTYDLRWARDSSFVRRYGQNMVYQNVFVTYLVVKVRHFVKPFQNGSRATSDPFRWKKGFSNNLAF